MVEEVIKICRRFKGFNYFVADEISARRLERVYKFYPVPAESRVLALLDLAPFGNAKYGLAICDTGLYWNNDWSVKSKKRNLTWPEFAAVEIRLEGELDLILGEGNKVSLTASSIEIDAFIRMLRELQGVVRPGAEQTRQAGGQPMVNEILDICDRYTADNFFIGSGIPQRKLSNVLKVYPVPAGASVLALVDATVFGSAKNGLAITDQGIVWNNDWTAVTKRRALSWAELAKLEEGEITLSGQYDIQIGPDAIFGMAASLLPRESLVALLLELRDLARRQAKAEVGREWFLGVNGESIGPYQLETIREMCRSGQLNPAVTYAWREGMADWLPFNEVPELARLVGPGGLGLP